MNNSIWAETAAMPSFPKLTGDLKTGVLIIGGGLTGILCAWKLHREGVDYALIEADRICHGVTRNTTAKITSQHGPVYAKIAREFDLDTAKAYYEVNEAALEEYRRMARDIDCDFEGKDSYIYTLDNLKPLYDEMNVLEQIGARAAFTDHLKLPLPVAGAICFPDQGQFNPLKFVSAISKELRIYEHTKALEFAGNTVVTDAGRISASKIIVATHFPILNKHGSYFLKMYQERSYVLALENAEDVDGMYLGVDKEGLSFRNYGKYLLLGGGSHRTGKQGRGWAELEKFAKIHYPEAKQAYRWATQDCMTLDGLPYIGRYSARTPNLYAATGFNKWGMTGSMVAASILTDLVQGRSNLYAPVFSPSRTMLRRQLLTNAVESTVNLLTPTVPRCPHLGCALKWNKQEHSWDCPCHGSRFEEDGTLLDNPAKSDLNTKKDPPA